MNISCSMNDHEGTDLMNSENMPVLTRKEVQEMMASGKSLEGVDARKANLVKMDFTGKILTGVKFSYANLKDAVFTDADLRGASLWNANLEGVDFTGANLEDADLDYAKLRGANFFRANIRRAIFPTELISFEEIRKSVDTGSKIGARR